MRAPARALHLTFALALACLSAACGAARSPAATPPTGAIATAPSRVLCSGPSLRDPLDVALVDGQVAVRYTRVDGVERRLLLDPATLEVRGDEQRPRDARSETAPPYRSARSATALLADGTNVIAWTDAATGRVVAEVLAPGEVARGAGASVSESADVLGFPRLATDGRNVVAVYFAARAEGYDLVATRVPTARRGRRGGASACNDALRADVAPRATAWGEALEPRESAADRMASAGACAGR